MVTCPWEPPVVDEGTSVRPAGSGEGVSVRVQFAVTPPARAETVTWVGFATGVVLIGNESPPAPAGMVNVAGTTAAGEELDRFTTNPPGGASPSQKPAKQPTSRSTIPNMSAPPVAFTGNSWKGVSFRVGGSNVIVVEAEVPLYVAVTVTGVGVVTNPTRIPRRELGNPVGATSTSPEELPAAICRDAGSLGSRAG
jgi:hypothetical protein